MICPAHGWWALYSERKPGDDQVMVVVGPDAYRVAFWQVGPDGFRAGILDAGDGVLVNAEDLFGDFGELVGFHYDPVAYDDPSVNVPTSHRFFDDPEG